MQKDPVNGLGVGESIGDVVYTAIVPAIKSRAGDAACMDGEADVG